MKKKLIIIIIAVVLVVAAVSLYLFVFKKAPEKIYSYYEPGDYFVTNVKDSNSLIKTTIVLEIYAYEKDLEDIEAYLSENNHILRDVIVFTLRSKTEEELLAEDIDETLPAELVERINEELDIDYISTVYFNDYVVQ